MKTKRKKKMTPQEILGVPPTATPEEIRKAYLELVKKHHPDLATDDKKKEAEEKTKEINIAYEELTNPKPKKNINQFSYNPFGINIDEMLKRHGMNVHNFTFNGGNSHFTQIFSQDVDIDLKKALIGGEVEVNIGAIGKTIKFPLPSPVQAGQVFNIRLNKEKNNELVLQLRVNVILPTLNDEQKKKIEEIL